MREVVFYEAFDGTPFRNEDECYEYECTTLTDKYRDEVVFYDSDFKSLPLVPESIERTFYIKVKECTPEIKWMFELYSNQSGFDLPDLENYPTGLFCFQDAYTDNDEWTEIDFLIQDAEKKVQRLKELKDSFN